MKSGSSDKAVTKEHSTNQIWAVTGENKWKSSSPSQNLYSLEVKPLLILLRALGRFPYSFKKNGEFHFNWFSLPVFYTIAFYIGQSVWTYYSLEILCRVDLTNSSTYDETLYRTSITIFNTHNFLIPFTYWIDAPKIVNYIKCWKDVQDLYYSDGMNLVLRVPILVFAVMILPAISGVLLLQYYLLSTKPVLIVIPYLSSLGGVTTFLMFWIATLHEIRNISRQLMCRLQTERHKAISHKRIIWLQLSRLTTKLGDTMGKTGLSTLVLLFATFVPTAYGILAYFFDHSITSKSFWGLLLSAVFCLALKFCFCDAAHRTTYTVGENFTGKILKQELSCLNQENMNEEQCKQSRFPQAVIYSDQKHMVYIVLSPLLLDQLKPNLVTLFLQTMTANPPNIQLHGFVTINRGLFVTFLSNTVTYLVVLLQFKVSAVSMPAVLNSVKYEAA